MNDVNNESQADATMQVPVGSGKRLQPVFDIVTDKRKNRVRGLWRRGQTLYGQLRVTSERTQRKEPRKVALKATTIPQALKELAELKKQEAAGEFKGRQASPDSVIVAKKR
ncbi:MAG TPA: hypothetical protein VM680_03095 [Verrucomicrobiae bacterium]|nr:hypothetical protein [Verrucomicrobiae bacterium]